MSPSELLAREQIRDLVARYNALGDSGRLDALLDLFSPNAVVEIADGPTYRGSARIRSLFAGAAGPPEPGTAPTRIWHHTSTLVIDCESDELARGRCYFAVLTTAGLDHWGRYRDVYTQVDRRWRFAHRRVSVDGSVAGGWADHNLGRLPD